MLAFDSIRELKNGKRHNTARKTTLSKNKSSEISSATNFCETKENEGPKIEASRQNAVNEQFENFTASPTRRLDDLTRLV